MEKKKLRKLVLNKEPIANLNNMNMSQLKGGSTAACVSAAAAVSAFTVAVSALTYDIYQSFASWFSLPTAAGGQTDCVNDDGPKYNSDVIMYSGCVISPIVVTP